MLGPTTNETILQYINILQYLLLQYNTIWLKKVLIYCILQYVVIYCNVYCLRVVNIRSLHCKINGPLVIWIIQFSFLLLAIWLYKAYIVFFVIEPIFPYEMSFYQNLVTYYIMAIYWHKLKHNTQHGFEPYCITPSTLLYSNYCHASNSP